MYPVNKPKTNGEYPQSNLFTVAFGYEELDQPTAQIKPHFIA